MGLYPRIVVSNPSNLPQGPESNVYFVDYNNGSDNNSGDRREKPFESILAAIAVCDDAMMDTIFVTSPVHVEATQPIVVDKVGVRIIGLPPPAKGSQPGTWIFPGGQAGGIFTLAGGDIHIENFMIWGTAGSPCIDFQAGATFVRNSIKNCWFTTGTYGIQTGPANNQPGHHLCIEDCVFQEGLTGGGIYLDSNGSWGIIRGNYFDKVPGPQLDAFTGNPSMNSVRVLDNYFLLDSDTDGEAIWIGGVAQRWFVDGNVAADQGLEDPGNTPFGQTGTDCVWGRNYRGSTVVVPVNIP